MKNSMKIFGATVATALTLGLNVLPSLAATVPATVDIGQCNGATALITGLPADDDGNGFAGGDTAALLVNSGVGEAGVAFLPDYSGIKPHEQRFTNGAIVFRDDGVTRKNTYLNFCIGSGGTFFASKPMTSFSISSLGGGWSVCNFNTRDIGTSQSVLNKLTVTLSTRGNMIIGNTYWNLYGSPPNQVVPATIDSNVKGCNILNKCN